MRCGLLENCLISLPSAQSTLFSGPPRGHMLFLPEIKRNNTHLRTRTLAPAHCAPSPFWPKEAENPRDLIGPDTIKGMRLKKMSPAKELNAEVCLADMLPWPQYE